MAAMGFASRKSWRTALALCLSLSLLFTMGLVRPFAADGDSVNKMENPGFEDGFASWRASADGAFVLSTDVVHSGDTAMAVPAGTSAWGPWLYHDVAVETGKDYVVSAWVNTASGYYIKISGAGGVELASLREDAADTGGGWSKLVKVFNAGENTQITIEIGTAVDVAANVYYDDFFVGEEEPAPIPDEEDSVNLIANPGMERDFDFWRSENLHRFAIANTVSFNGERALIVPAGTAAWGPWLYHDVAVEAGKDYAFSVWVNTASGYYIKFSGAGGSTLAELKEEAIDTAGGWVKLTRVINTGDNTQITLEIGTAVDVTSNVYYDDFFLGEEEPAPAETAHSANRLANGDFESGFGGWRSETLSSFLISQTVTHGGTKAMGVPEGTPAWGPWLYHDAAVTPGTDYVLSVWVNTASGYYVKVSDTASGAEITALNSADANTEGGWQQLSLPFNSGDAAMVTLEVGTSVAVTSTVYYDDFVLCQKETEPMAEKNNLVANPSFEEGYDSWRSDTPEKFPLCQSMFHSGANSLVVPAGAAAWGSWIYHDVAVQPETLYTLSVWINTANGYYVKVANGGQEITALNSADADTLGRWEKISLDFNSGAATTITLELGTAVDVTADIHYDDFFVGPKGSEPEEPEPIEPDNLLKNPGFEEDFASWRPAVPDTFEISTDVFHGGAKALTVPAGSGAWSIWLYNDFAITPNKEYALSVWVNTADGYYVKVSNKADGSEITALHADRADTDGGWQQFAVSFNSGSATMATIEVGTSVDVAPPVYYDDFEVKLKVKRGFLIRQNGNGTETCPDDANGITDSGCDDEAYWAEDAEGYGEAVSVSSTGGREGGALKIQGQGSYTKWLDVDADSLYCLTFEGMVDMEEFADVVFEIVDQDGVPLAFEGSANTVFNEIRVAGQDGLWHKRTLFIQLLEADRIGFRVVAKSGTVYLDNLKLYKDSDKTAQTNTFAKASVNKWSSNTSYGCAEEDNLFPNGLLLDGAKGWQDVNGFGRFMTLDTHAGAPVLRYANSGGKPYYYMVPVKVRPHTEYVFSHYARVNETGKAAFGLLDGDPARSNIDYLYELSDKTADGQWGFYTLNFTSGDSDTVYFAVYDGGGEALFAKMRLFELKDAQPLDMLADTPPTDPAGDGNGEVDNVDTGAGGYAAAVAAATLSGTAVACTCGKKRKKRATDAR